MSCTFDAPPGTSATIPSIASWLRLTSGSISGVIRVASSRDPIRPAPRLPGWLRPPGSPAPPACGVVKSARTSACNPRWRIRSIDVTARSEWPPSSKKLSSRPTRSLQHLRPDPRQRLLHLALRRLVAARHVRVPVRRRQGLAVELAVRRQRQRLEPHVRRGHHVLRQPLASMLPHRFGVGRARPRVIRPPGACPRARPREPGPPPRTRPPATTGATSISPSSTRNPRTFTWKSLRPISASPLLS